MKYLTSYKVFESYNLSTTNVENVIREVEDILYELSDSSFTTNVIGDSGNYIIGSLTREFIEIHISCSEEIKTDIMHVYKRICEYIESEGYEKSYHSENGRKVSNHITSFNFMEMKLVSFNFREINKK